MELAFDPDRVRHLRASTRAALDELDDLRSGDPLAADAVRAVRLTRRNLAEMWLPFLDEIGRSVAMTAWSPSTAVAETAEQLMVMLRAMVLTSPWRGGVPSLVAPVPAIDLMRRMLADPHACLDALGDRAVLVALASSAELPDELVERFVVAALETAAVDGGRLGDGYDVLRVLTDLANGHFDDGISPGMARGVATALSSYWPTLAPAVRHEGRSPVLVVDERIPLEVELGTYDDVVDLVAVLLRDQRAQVALGAGIGRYAIDVVHDLGGDVAGRPELGHVARVTDLVADATRTEQVELEWAAEETEAARRRIGTMVGIGVDAALTAAGAGGGSRQLTRMAVDTVASRLADTDAAQLPDTSIPATTYDAITVATIAALAGSSAGARRRVGVSGVGRREWAEIERRLGEIEGADGPSERRRAVIRLERWIESNAAPLAVHLTRVQATPGMEELTEARAAVGAD